MNIRDFLFGIAVLAVISNVVILILIMAALAGFPCPKP